MTKEQLNKIEQQLFKLQIELQNYISGTRKNIESLYEVIKD